MCWGGIVENERYAWNATAMANGMSKVDEYTDEENELTVVYAIKKGDK